MNPTYLCVYHVCDGDTLVLKSVYSLGEINSDPECFDRIEKVLDKHYTRCNGIYTASTYWIGWRTVYFKTIESGQHIQTSLDASDKDVYCTIEEFNKSWEELPCE